jgi:hypothetical protein
MHLFIPYHICLDCDGLIEDVPQSILDHFLKTHSGNLSSYERTVLQKAIEAPYRFYQIQRVEDYRVYLRDLIGAKTCFIELSDESSKNHVEGDIVCLRLIEEQKKYIPVVELPFLLSEHNTDAIMQLGKWLKDSKHPIHKAFPDENRLIINEYWRLLREEMVPPQQTFEKNEDGDYIEPNVLVYKTDLPLQTLIHKLAPLSDTPDPQEFELCYGVLDDKGERIGVDFPRVDEYETSIAYFRVRAGEVQVETNSAKRSGRIKSSLTRRFGKDLRLLDQIWIPKKQIEHYKQTVLSDDMKMNVGNFLEDYFASWIDLPLEGIGKTPRELSQSVAGQKILQMIFSEFEKKNAILDDDLLKVDVDWLRKTLGMS